MKILAIILLALTTVSFQGISFSWASEYDGSWSFRVTVKQGPCNAAPGTITITDGKIKGKLLGVNEEFNISGKVSDAGFVKGRISKGMGNFKGEISRTSGTLSFNARPGCRGSVNVRKM